MDGLTHRVEITITGSYPHGDSEHASVVVKGDGSLNHMFEAFKAALVVAGFDLDTVKKLDDLDI